MRRPALLALAAAALSLLVVAPVPSYDPWSWLLWGRELTRASLSTTEGPAFKPLPVAVCAALAPLGSWAPPIWVWLARAGSALAVALAYRIGRELTGTVAAGVCAAGGVALTGGYVELTAQGLGEGPLTGLALSAWTAERCGRRRLAVAAAVACALLRVETWPFLLLWAAGISRRAPRRRLVPVAVAAALALIVVLSWFVPEWVGSGVVLRSAARARVPNPGQPALADVPAAASLQAALVLPPWPAWVGVGVLAVLSGRRWHARRPARARPGLDPRAGVEFAAGPWCAPAGAWLVPAVAGLGWIALVAAMAQAGFSGEARYASPGAALIGLSGGIGLGVAGRRLWASSEPASGAPARSRTWAARPVAVVVVAVVTAASVAGRADAWRAVRAGQLHQQQLSDGLRRAVRSVGGREAVMRCGTPYVGPGRGPLLAYHLEVHKHLVEPDAAPTPPGMVFRSPGAPGAVPAPDVPGGFTPLVRIGPWEVSAQCRAPSAADRTTTG